jgi:Flp pilus assembly protein TadB
LSQRDDPPQVFERLLIEDAACKSVDTEQRRQAGAAQVLWCFVLYCSVLFCIVLFCSVLFCSVLFCSVLFCSVLFFSVLFRFTAVLL